MTFSSRLLEARAFAAPRQQDKFTPWARAVVAVGKHLYGDEWEFSEKAREKYLPHDRVADIEAEVSKRYPAPAVPKAAPPVGGSFNVGKPIDPALMARIREAGAARRAERDEYAKEIDAALPPYADLAATNDARKARLLAAESKLFGAVLNKHLPAYWYADGTASEPSLMPIGELVKEWNSTGGGNLTRRGYIWRDRAAWHVYLDTAKLADAFPLNPLRETAVGSISLDQLSPYLQLMIQVSLEQGVTAHTRTKPQALGDILRNEAPKFGLTVGKGNDGSDITKTWATQLGKALRWPDARKGRAEPGSTRKG
ncbi:MAG: hypothetical protein JNN10_04505 [Sphingopyxis sp.]|uniref:hypothetical protein n=1 Tax=Sphingopyxis sp. TaxID=1908224 RepID=UPI001A53672D|nr:hypothetical protein [Sphingopyxis sp.]MBL9065536.1 hypothetical protein [Sphingopyxis sp.]